MLRKKSQETLLRPATTHELMAFRVRNRPDPLASGDCFTDPGDSQISVAEARENRAHEGEDAGIRDFLHKEGNSWIRFHLAPPC